LIIAEFLIFGLIQSSIYALLAVGFSLVYGVGGVLNLGHGAFFLLSTYIFYFIWKNFTAILGDFSFLFGLIMALIIIVIIGMLLYILLIKPLQDNEVGVMISTFAFGFFAEQLVTAFEPRTQSISTIWNQPFNVLGVQIQLHQIILIGTSLVIIFILITFINKSRLGKSIRAVSQDREAASLMGINVNRVIMYTVMISAFLAGLAAVFSVPLDRVAPYLGWVVLTDSISIVILGGMGSLKGSLIGAFILGYVRIYTLYFINSLISTLMPIIVLIIILLIRPRGLFGKKELD
jgi:branched-chain amino acid transport system permease protein